MLGAVFAFGGDRVIADFEGEDWGGWTVEGEAFGSGPSAGSKAGQAAVVRGFRGKGLANSFAAENGKGSGSLLSPAFTIDRNYINFLLGGGDRPGRLCVNLLVDGQVVRTATAGKNFELKPFGWDVRDLYGATARVEIVDREAETKRSDYIILVDDIRLSDAPVIRDMEEEVTVSGNYINVPVADVGFRGRLTVEVEGKVVVDTFIRPASGKGYRMASIPSGKFLGKKAIVRIENVPAGELVLRQSEAVAGLDNVYNEKWRPQFHFSARSGWLNDPNGLVHEDGNWHLYFQYDPYNIGGLAKFWGHAVSRDLVHWKELPIAIKPFLQTRGETFSGSAVMDLKNRSGFGRGDKVPLVAVLTDTDGRRKRGTGPAEVLAFSNDGGLSFEMYEGNPILEHSGRDPKAFWWPVEDIGQEKGHWVMAVYRRGDGKDWIDIYVSEDLKKWERTDSHEGYYECPDLTRTPVLDAGGRRTGEWRWVMMGGDGKYCVGGFDGRVFRTEQAGAFQTHFGAVYASQTWNGAPDGRAVQIFWMRVTPPESPFNQMMSVPMELGLRRIDGDLRLVVEPVRELEKLRGEKVANLEDFDGSELDLEAEFEAPKAGRVVLKLGKNEVVWENGKLEGVALPAREGIVKLRVLVDRPCIEVFGNGGEVYFAKRRVDGGAEVGVKVVGEAKVRQLAGWRVGAGWKE